MTCSPRRWAAAAVVWAVLAGPAACLSGGVGSDGAPAPPELPPPSMSAGDSTRASDSGSAADSARGEPREADRTRVPEVRALWIVRTALVHPDSARAAVQRAHRAGFNTLLVQVRGRGDAWYRSSLEPRAEALAGAPADYDPLEVVLDEARARGLRVHAWVNVHLVAGTAGPPSDPRHVARRNPELLAVPRELARELTGLPAGDPAYLHRLLEYTRRSSGRLEGLYTSPVHPEVRDGVAAVVGELIDRYPVDGVHLDYLRLPSSSFDHGPGAMDAFREWLRETAPDAEVDRERGDPLAYVDAFPAEWNAFRRRAVTATLERVVGEIRRRRPGLPVTAAVFPDPERAAAERFQPWTGWVREGWLDAVAPMAYTGDDGTFLRYLERAMAAVDEERVWMGVGAYIDTLDGAVGKAQAAVGAGAGGVALFSYDWAVGPEGRAVAAGEYLARFGESVFTPRSDSPPFAR